MENRIPPYLVSASLRVSSEADVKRSKFTFIDKTILNSAKALKSIYLQAENAARDNIIHNISPHIKLFSLIYMAVIISIVNSIMAQLIITAAIFLLYLTARLKIAEIYRKIFLLAFIFGFLVVFPASLNVITPGEIIFNLASFSRPVHFLIYSIPQEIGFTVQGLEVVALVFLRVLNSVSFALLIVFTTSFPKFIKSFRILGVPDTFLMIISLAYKYIFILARTIEESYFAFKSRLSGNIESSSIRRLVSGRIFFTFRRSMIIYENTYHAMVSRGYRGQVILYSRNRFTFRDFLALFIVLAFGIVIILIWKQWKILSL